MVKSWVCPKCLEDLTEFYTEEGGTRVIDGRLECPCGYVLEGAVDDCCGEIDNAETNKPTCGTCG